MPCRTNNDCEVAVVAADPDWRHAVQVMLLARGFACQSFADMAAFHAVHDAACTCCLILGVGVGGLSAIAALRTAGYALPILWVNGRPDDPFLSLQYELGLVERLAMPLRPKLCVAAVERLQARFRNADRGIPTM